MKGFGARPRRDFVPCFCSSFSHFPSHPFFLWNLYWLYPTSAHHHCRKLHMSVVCRTVLGGASSDPLSSRLCILHIQELHHAYHDPCRHTCRLMRASLARAKLEQNSRCHFQLPALGLSTLSDLRSGVGCMIVAIQLEVRISCELDLILAGLPVGTPTSLTFYLGMGYPTAS